MRAVHSRQREVQGIRAAELGQEDLVEAGPDAGLRPLGQAAPAGHARPEAEFLREVFPADPGVQDEQDALEHQPVRMSLPPWMPRPTLNLG